MKLHKKGERELKAITGDSIEAKFASVSLRKHGLDGIEHLIMCFDDGRTAPRSGMVYHYWVCYKNTCFAVC